jgi:hypothetical protein
LVSRSRHLSTQFINCLLIVLVPVRSIEGAPHTDLHKRISEVRTEHDKEVLRCQIAATDDEIDRLVYELYGLTEEEIRIVEGKG